LGALFSGLSCAKTADAANIRETGSNVFLIIFGLTLQNTAQLKDFVWGYFPAEFTSLLAHVPHLRCSDG